ncbi:MAG: alpha/beta fold hydrolase [Pseudomonadota bacterium]
MRLSIRQIITVSALLALTACAAAPNLVGLGHGNSSSLISTDVTTQTLFVATSRQRSKDAAEFYSGERSQVMQLASVNVTVPPNHKTGQIEQPISGQPDPKRHFTIARPLVFDGGTAFRSNLNQALANRAVGDRSVLVFVHGYNTNFSAAVLRLAQFVHDSKFKGVPVLFTWASRGRALDYAYDTNSALQARFYMLELARMLADTEAESFSLVAHSMGNLVTLETMTALRKANFQPRAPLNSVILASPDVDIDLFREQIRELGPIKDRLFILISQDDKALQLSRTIAGGVSRAGDADPELLASMGLKVVDLSKIDDRSNTNHSKFADSPEIVQLIGRRLRAGNTLNTNASSPTQALVGSAFRGFTRVQSVLPGGGGGGIVTLGSAEPQN